MKFVDVGRSVEFIYANHGIYDGKSHIGSTRIDRIKRIIDTTYTISLFVT